MICIIVTCALVAGTAKSCGPGEATSAYYIEAPKVIKTAEECRATFKAAPMDSGRRKVTVDFRIPTTNELLRGQ